MLAYDPGLPVAYDPVMTAASLLGAMLTATAGFALADSTHAWRPVGGGAVIGAGIGLMHYTGMQALIVPGILHWDMALVAASVVAGEPLGDPGGLVGRVLRQDVVSLSGERRGLLAARRDVPEQRRRQVLGSELDRHLRAVK